tara:strand:- start:3179 stop:4342 length:1164 start_codon:yes stop_codon:yes gene_type:complete
MEKKYNCSDEVVLIAQHCDSRENSTGLYWQQIVQSLSVDIDVTLVAVEIHPKLFDTGCEVIHVSLKNSLFRKLMPEKLYVFYRMMFSMIGLSLKGKHLVIGTNPLFLPLAVPYFKILGTKSLTLLCYDLFPQNLMAQVGPVFRTLLRSLSLLYRASYKLCDNIIVVGRDMKEEFIKNGFSETSLHYIPNWGQRVSNDYKACQFGTDSKLKLLFFGNLGQFQGIPELLDQICHVKRKDVDFLFVGAGENQNLIQKYAKQDRRIKYLGQVPMSERDEVYKKAHLSIISVRPGMKGLCVPSKCYFALANQHPIIAMVEKNSEIDLLCSDLDCGWLIDYEDCFSMSNILDAIDEDVFKDKLNKVQQISTKLIDGTQSLHLIKNIMMKNLRS